MQSALSKTLIPRSDTIFILGTMCPTSVNGKPGIVMLHVCVNVTFFPSGSKIVMGFSASLLFLHGIPSITKTDVAPVLAMGRWVTSSLHVLVRKGIARWQRSLK